MTVKSLFINQGDELSLEDQELLLVDFLSAKINFPVYTAEGEINGKNYDFQLIPDKRSPQLKELELIND